MGRKVPRSHVKRQLMEYQNLKPTVILFKKRRRDAKMKLAETILARRRNMDDYFARRINFLQFDVVKTLLNKRIKYLANLLRAMNEAVAHNEDISDEINNALARQ
jgi:hypothetical protein